MPGMPASARWYWASLFSVMQTLQALPPHSSWVFINNQTHSLTGFWAASDTVPKFRWGVKQGFDLPQATHDPILSEFGD